MTEMNAAPTGANEVRPSDAAKDAYAAVVLKPSDDLVTTHASLAEKQVIREQGPDAGATDLGLIARGTGAWTELTTAVAAVTADEMLSDVGKQAAMEEPLAKAATEIRSMKAHADTLTASANQMEKGVLDAELLGHLDRAEVLQFQQTLAGIVANDAGEKWATGELGRIVSRHPSTWTERDAKLVAAVMLSVDTMPRPMLNDFARNAAFNEFVKHSEKAPHIKASRERAELIRRVAGTVERSVKGLAESRGLEAKWSEFMGTGGIKTTGNSPARQRWVK